jgi:cell division protein FtsI/penicillin-binding protein 2
MFGYGKSLIEPLDGIERNFRQTDGVIANSIPTKDVESFSDVGELTTSERRWFGIGQGNLRVSPLQVTTSMATIARGGNFKQPVLFTKQITDSNGTSFGIAREVIKHIRKGMYGVVNEYGGTAHTPFRSADFEKDGITVYGKTGSTEAPENAWFAGFAEYEEGKGIALSVIVEGGESGSHDAAPLGRKIIETVQKHGYLTKD